MADKSHLTRAYKQHNLWPQIHSAVDVFIKRRAAQADSYELTWRLIHIWECVVVTIAQASIARLLTIEKHKDDVQAIREKAYGRTWNSVDETIKDGVGALDGSIDKWIEILEYISKIKDVESPYLWTIANFLNSKVEKESSEPNKNGGSEENFPIKLTPFYTAWSRACEVPKGTPNDKTSVKGALKAVNSFRNRFAHVPFPYDPVQGIYKALEQCTEEMFSAPEAADDHKGALMGAIAFRQSILQGANTLDNTIIAQDCDPTFVHGLKGSEANENWLARSFIYIDQMQRPYVLTRLRDKAGLWEYTRYLAESNAVITQTDSSLFEDFPIPTEAEYYRDEEEDTAIASEGEEGRSPLDGDDLKLEVRRQVSDMGEATRAIRSRDFEPAIDYLEKRVKDSPNYHVGWLKLGQARREMAVDLWQEREDEDRARTLLEDSLSAFDNASRHIERRYEAEAFYNKSKSHFRLWQVDSSWDQLEKAIESAERSRGIYPESQYESWLEYLDGIKI